MNLKKILKSRRGVALENALLFMLVIFSLCALLTSLTLIGHFQTRINKLTLENEIALEQIGEDFLANPASFEYDKDYGNYTCRQVLSDTSYAVAVYPKSDTEYKTAVLYVEIAKENGEILYWCYSLPPHALPPA